MKQYLIILLLLLAGKAGAQSALRLQHISVDEGLSQSSVYCILQDSYGFMWFATGDGLNRYDGKEFIPYQSHFGDSSKQVYRTINSKLFEDKYNRLWLSTDAGVSYYDWRHKRSVVVIDSLATNAVLLGIDRDTLWSASTRAGFFGLDLNTLRYRYDAFTDPHQTNRDTLFPVSNGVVTSTGIWQVDKAGLYYLDRRTHQGVRVVLNANFNTILRLHNGKLLLTSQDGVYLFDTVTRKCDFIPIINEISSMTLEWRSVAEDTGRKIVYLGAYNSGVICRLNPTTQKYELINFQKGNINCLYIDRSENLWIGTEGNGAYKLDIKQPKFFCYTPNMSNSLDEADGFMVKSIYRDDSGNTWMGTYDKGLIVGDLATHKQRKIELSVPADAQLISTILKDSSGCMVTTIGNKMLWLDASSGRINKQVVLPRVITSSPLDPIIFSVIEWKKGHYIAGTNIGLFTIDAAGTTPVAYRPETFSKTPALASWIYNLHLEQNGYIYVGKRNGFAKMKLKQDTVAEVWDEGFPGVAVRHFYKSRTTGILWIATEKGLLAYNEQTKHFKVFDESNGMANSSVYGILPQNDSTLWISTNLGLSNLRVKYINDTGLNVQFINYTSKDGLQSNEFNTGSFYQSKDGTMFFGGIAGINWFNPKDIKANPYKALPAITGISINDSLFATDTSVYIHTLRLPYNRNTVSFTLKALEFTQPEQNQFAYMLEGVDKDWVITANDKVRYSNLPPGTYTFLLKVSNNEGIWNDDVLKTEIIIMPPYWQTWWFRMLTLIIAVSIVLLSIRLYVRQKVRTKTRELEKQQALYMERLRISKDVHDDLGSGLSKISLMAEIAQKKATGNPNISNDIHLISEVSKELVDNMHDLIWILNPENTTLEQLVARLREYCSDYLENIPLEVSLNFPDDVPAMRIPREAQRNIFLTTKEAINNCIKHAHASTLAIVVAINGAGLDISVTDNGEGFDPAKLKGSGNGLRNMRQRIESIGGNFAITTAPGATKVAISVPFDALSTEKITL